MNHYRITLTLFLVLFGGLSYASGEAGSTVSDALYFGGPILSMEGAQPQYVEAVAVKNGLVSKVGPYSELHASVGKQTQLIDLKGKALMPGFIDTHSHVANVGLKLATVNLDSEPAGHTGSIDDIISQLRDRLKNQPPAEGGWLLGMGYDNAMLKEQRHPTKNDLDKVSTEVPIFLIHFSGHMATMNSKALAKENINAGTPDPDGGAIHRIPNSKEPSGVVEETAMRGPMLKILAGLGNGTQGGGRSFLERGLDVYARNGYTTVIEGAATPAQVGDLERLAAEKKLKQDVIALQFFETATPEEVSKNYSPQYKGRFRVGGGKVILDGGSPGRTAYLREPYYTPTPGQPTRYRGYPTIKDQQVLNQLIGSYYHLSTPIHIHALGDAAMDMSIAAIKSAEAKLAAPHDKRTQLIHAQQVQGDQFAQLKNLDVAITFQIAHNFYFGDYHRKVIYGPERTLRLNPIRDAINNGIPISIHHDAPVHPVDQMMLIWAAVNRESRSGWVSGAEQRLTVYEALQASTINAAYQFFEEQSKGSLTTGKKADMIVLNKDPLKVDKSELRYIKVLRTIKDGATIWTENTE